MVEVDVSQNWNASLIVMMILSNVVMAQGPQSAKDTFIVEVKPNMDSAVNNEYAAQSGTVEVLKGWMTRFIAPDSVVADTVTWWNGKTQLGKKGQTTLDYQETKIGLFWDVMKAQDKKTKQMVEAGRWVVMGNVKSIDLNLQVGGENIRKIRRTQMQSIHRQVRIRLSLKLLQ